MVLMVNGIALAVGQKDILAESVPQVLNFRVGWAAQHDDAKLAGVRIHSELPDKT